MVPEGRPSAPVPVNSNVTQVAPDGSGIIYEKMRIKRTVAIDPAAGLQNNWDVLYNIQDSSGSAGDRTVYCCWDDDYLYLAAEMPTTQAVRFDIDGRDDGWLRGADNLALLINPPDENKSPNIPGNVDIQRFDTVQNRDQPVWAASPIPLSALRIKVGRTPQGTYAVCVALPRTEMIGLDRKPGGGFGLRVETAATLPSLESEINNIAVRPMLRLGLADTVDAAGGGLTVHVGLTAREITPQDTVKATLEIKNTTQATIRVGKMFLRGAVGSAALVDSGTFTGADIPAGKSIKRELRTTISPTAPFGGIVLTGGVETAEVGTLAALATFSKVEPYDVKFDLDQTPIPPGTVAGDLETRDARVTIRARAGGRENAKVTLALPTGWKIDKEDLVRNIRLSYSGDIRGTLYRIIVPEKVEPGRYPIKLTVEAGGRTYNQTGEIVVLK